MDFPGGVAVSHPVDKQRHWGLRGVMPLSEIDDVRQPWHERPEVVHGRIADVAAASMFLGVSVGVLIFAFGLIYWLVYVDLPSDASMSSALLEDLLPVLPALLLFVPHLGFALWIYIAKVTTCTSRAYALNYLSSDDAVLRIGSALTDNAALHIVMACYHNEPRGADPPWSRVVTWTGRKAVVGLSALAAEPAVPLETLLPQRGDKPIRLFLPARGVLTPAARSVVESQVSAYVAAHAHRDSEYVVAVQLVLHRGFQQRLTVYAPGQAPRALGPAAWTAAVALCWPWVFELVARARASDRQLTIARTFVVKDKERLSE